MFPTSALIVRTHGRSTRLRFLLKERALSWFADGPGLRILFSRKDDWEVPLRRAFAHTRHELEFGELIGRDFSRYDLVVPLTVADTLVLATQRSALVHNPLPIPDARCVHLCNDKYLLNRELIALGFAEFIPTMLDEPTPPFMLKARVAENSERCYIIGDAADQAQHQALIGNEAYFCQQLVSGRSEFAAHMLVAGGRIVTETTIEYVADRELFIKADAAFLGRKVGCCAFAPLFERMLAGIGFEGLCCINYKVVNGRPMLLEINPRFGASLAPFFFAFIRHLRAARQLIAAARGSRRA